MPTQNNQVSGSRGALASSHGASIFHGVKFSSRLAFAAVASCCFGSLAIAADNSGPSDVLSAYLAKHYWQQGSASKSLALAGSIESGVFLGRARSQFRTGDFAGAIQNLDLYLSLVEEDVRALLLRGLSKRLVEPPDIEGACADLQRVAELGFDINVIAGFESDCTI